MAPSLLVRAGRERPVRGFQANVAVDLAAFKEIEEWSGANHGATR